MLQEIDSSLITVHGRIALGLLAAEHVLPLVSALPSTHALLERMLRADWSWMEARTPDPSKLYWDYVPQLSAEDVRLARDEHLPVLHCGLYAHDFAIWKAEGVATVECPGTVLSIGNDIAEVDESYLSQCLKLAVEVSPRSERTAEWLNHLITEMERERREAPSNVVGRRLHRKDFTLPAIAI